MAKRELGIDEAQAAWLAKQPQPVKENPCIKLYGPGPEAKRCGDCTHIKVMGGYSKRIYKCDLRPITGGEASDHRLKWHTCEKFEDRDGS